MAIPFPYTSSDASNLHTASYLNQNETSLFVAGFSKDLWFGFSPYDDIELSAYDLNGNSIGWSSIETNNVFVTSSFTYLNAQDRPVTSSFLSLVPNYILYKNESILVNPLDQLSASFGLTTGSYLVSYNFIREMAGDVNAPLTVKDISPSRTEIKLVPSTGNNARYQAFCLKQFVVEDVAPLLIQLTNNCPYSTIYGQLRDVYPNEINFLKHLWSTNTDGEFLIRIKNLYEDLVIYTSPQTANQPLEKISRTQGIRTYYQNYLISNYNSVGDFFTINSAFATFTQYRIGQELNSYPTSSQFVSASQFLNDFFVQYFYSPIVTLIEADFNSKYYTYFKNVVNFGNNEMYSIVDHNFIDERLFPTDPLTLICKMKEALPQSVKVQGSCWVSNVSITPYVANIILQASPLVSTIRIGPPNFSIQSDAVSLYNNNTTYTAADLTNQPSDQQAIDVNRKINELQVDYTDFTNFVIFSSAAQRLSNFKTKVSNWTVLSASLSALEYNVSQSFVSGTTYPYYSSEETSLNGQMNAIVASFDGYESYLFDAGLYAYDPINGIFINSSYVASQDTAAAEYDQENIDSLVNNTPDHVIQDPNNSDYVLFLMMIGHFFDNLYLYISNLPSEKAVDVNPDRTFTKQTIDQLLEQFGWKLGNTYEDAATLDVFTTSLSSAMSAEDRTKAIRTRLLSSLPYIYKTKGTEEAIQLILSCHGIPSNLLDIREYGNDDFVTSSIVTYTKQERACMLYFTGSVGHPRGTITSLTQTFIVRPSLKTFETKLLIENPAAYPFRKLIPLVTQTYPYFEGWDIGWYYHASQSAYVPSYQAQGYYPAYYTLPAWELGFWREYGNYGKMYARIAAWNPTSSLSQGVTASLNFASSSVFLTSSLLPIFDGTVFNVRLRRNYPDPGFTTPTTEELLPTVYDLTVQRNEAGRQIFRSITSQLGQFNDNMVWDGYSLSTTYDVDGNYLGNPTLDTTGSWVGNKNYNNSVVGNNLTIDSTITIGGGRNVSATLNQYQYLVGNTMAWDVPISDGDFDVHCNDFSSFGYTGADTGETHLIIRIDADEPINFSGGSGGSGLNVSSYISNSAEYYPNFSVQYSAVVASSSWVGMYSGSLSTLATYQFVGSTTGSIYGVLSGSGVGVLNSSYLEYWIGTINGTCSGTFSGSAVGILSGSDLSMPLSGTFSGFWTGSVTGSFNGRMVSGSTGISQITGSNSPYQGLLDQGLVDNFMGSFYGTIQSIYLGPLVYAYGLFTGSFMQIWTGSVTQLYGKVPIPQSTYYSTNGGTLHPSYSAYPGYPCIISTSSVYPWQYVVMDMEKTFTTPKYGPNRFKNEKVKQNFQRLQTRLDDKTRSTADLSLGIQADSNLLGLYLDPQDAKNRTIVKFLGNWDLMNTIGDPGNMFSASYPNLVALNQQFNSFGDRRVFYNELITLYKIYFNRTVFDEITNVLPARTNARTGVVIENTILERPKYQYKPVVGEANSSSVYYPTTVRHYSKDPIKKLVRLADSVGNASNGKLQVLYGDFGFDTSYTLTGFDPSSLPANPTLEFDLSYVSAHNFEHPVNFNNGYIEALPDQYQFGSAFDTSSVLVKHWTKYDLYFRNGPYVRGEPLSADNYVTQSVWLYNVVPLPLSFYNTIFYTQDTYVLSGSVADLTETPILNGGSVFYHHYANTAIGTPNQIINTINGTPQYFPFSPVIAGPPYFNFADNSYFEFFSGEPWNYYTHKRMQFSPVRFLSLSGNSQNQTPLIYTRGQQTATTTIDPASGLENGTDPVQTIQTSNVNLVQANNVINQ